MGGMYGIGEDRPRIKIEIADVIAPPQARPEDEFRVRVEVIGEGLANEELKGLVWTPKSMRLPPEERARERGLKNPLIWWAIITAATLFFYIRFA